MASKSYNSMMMMLGLAMANSGGINHRSNSISDKNTQPKFKFYFSIPKGAKLYLFESNGNFESFTEFESRNEMPNYCVFHCIAINNNSAINKFTKFKSKINLKR